MIGLWPTLITGFHSTDYTTPGIHDTFTKRDDVVKHLIRSVWAGLNSSSLLQNLRNYRQVLLECSTDSASNVTETLKNGGLELIGKGSTLKYVSMLTRDGIK